jgi:excisionase family DNA binding protein
MAVITSPALVLGVRDARWLAAVLGDLLDRRYFPPGLAERAALVAHDCRTVATGGQGEAEPLLTYGQAAIVANVSERTMRRLVASGRVPAVRLGAAVRIRREDLEDVS